jgi:hypothetical protein
MPASVTEIGRWRLIDISSSVAVSMPIGEAGPAVHALVECARLLEFSESEMRQTIGADRRAQLRRAFAAVVEAIDSTPVAGPIETDEEAN